MFAFFANLFGYLLNFLYNLIQNYGVAMILFTIIVKIILLPISIKQQKTMKQSTKLQGEIKKLQVKHKNNPEALQRETMELYKREGMNPFAGCFSAIVQFILIISVFFLVKSPLTYMKKVDPAIIEKYTNEINNEEIAEESRNEQNNENNEEETNQEENTENGGEAESKDENKEEKKKQAKDAYPEISIIREKSKVDDEVYINMEFLGLDLSSIPSKDIADWKTYVIPVLYVISTFISMKITTSMQKKQKDELDKKNGEQENEGKLDQADLMMQTNKNMMYMMPILAVSISLVAPLGLALYWLTNNILMIIERLLLNIFIKDKEEEN